MSAASSESAPAGPDQIGQPPLVPVVTPGWAHRSTASATCVDVLHVVNGEHYAGAERVQDLLALCLPDYGFRVGFVCLKPKLFPELRQSRAAALYRVPMLTRFDLRAVWRLKRIIGAGGYRLLHAHTPRAAMIAHLAARATGLPMVYHIHSPSWHDSTRTWQDRLNARIERLSLRGPVRMIAVSESLAGQMAERGFARSAITVVHNGVPRAQPAPYRPAPQGEWILGMIALFRPRKGTEVLLEAAARLRAENRPIRLRLVGPFESRAYEGELKRRASRLGLEADIEWTGFRPDVFAELAAMDLFVLPSLFGEGLPMVVLEAMSAGVPVIAARVEGLSEAIRDRQDGLLSAPGDASDLARAIREVVDGRLDWSQLRTSALGRQGQQFSDQSMAQGVAGVYREILG